MEAVRPKLRAGVFFAPNASADGTLLSGGGRVVTLRGAATYQWLERLAPRLDGSRTLGELLSALPENKRQMVLRLVTALRDADFIRDLAADEPHSLTEAELTDYAAQIDFIEAFRDSPGKRFQDFRESRMLLTGDGAPFAAALDALTRVGARHVNAVPAGDLSEELVDQVDAVLYVTDRPQDTVVDTLDRAGTFLVPAVVVGDAAWIGPVLGPHRPGRCWADVWQHVRPAAPTEFLTGPVPAIIANHAVFACFEHLTGVVDDDDPVTAVRLDLETLQTSEHRVPPRFTGYDVRPRTEQQLLDRVRELESGPPVDDSALEELLPELTDDVLGLFTMPDERDFVQFPLRVLASTVGSETVHATGPDFETARARAVFRAAERYAASSEPALGVSLVDGTVVSLDAEGVVAAGRDWASAVRTALLEHCLRITVSQVDAATEPYGLVAHDFGRLGELLDIVGQKVSVYDVTRMPGVPVYAFRVDDDFAYRTGSTPEEALAAGLEWALAAHQAGFLDPRGPRLSGELLTDSPASSPVDHVHPLKALLEAGYHPAVVPLDVPALPYVARVVLLDA